MDEKYMSAQENKTGKKQDRENQSGNTVMGILAHVDAGKTTLSESILYKTGAIRTHGRVDHQDTFLDQNDMERKRGITIYSKTAQFEVGNRPFTLVDTPGHVDFSPEMERTLRILDVAILVVNVADLIAQNGTNPQLQTIWRLLAHYHVPTFLFVNKMDQQREREKPEDTKEEQDEEIRKKVMSLLSQDLGEGLVSFDGRQLCSENEEACAVCSEELTKKVLSGCHVREEDVQQMVHDRKLFAVYFGSALKDEGTDELLEGLRRYSLPYDSSPLCSGQSPHPFGAMVYKITREEGVRLTWMKITSGTLSVRDRIEEKKETALPEEEEEEKDNEAAKEGAGKENKIEGWKERDQGKGKENHSESEIGAQEKVSGIRLYSGSGYTTVTLCREGEIAAVSGLSYTHAGDGLGIMKKEREALLTPVMMSNVTAKDAYGKTVDDFTLLSALRELEEEEPMLHPEKDTASGQITVRIMGDMQRDVLTQLLKERHHWTAQFGQGSIVYQETIRRPVEGVGHFEPLKHYAEVHVLLEPGEPGSGLVFANQTPADTLDQNWQNLIMTNLQEKKHVGVLTGSLITDMKISLIGGKASKSHTVGGDFRKATYAAVRQALMMAENILLEPVLSYRLEVPTENLGRAMTDITRKCGTMHPATFYNEMAVLEGIIPASEYGNYPQILAEYSAGKGQIAVSLKGYEPCHNAREVMDRIGYDPDADEQNPSWSVFCSHGAGTIVPWDHVRQYMHLDTGWRNTRKKEQESYITDEYYTFAQDNPDPFDGEEEKQVKPSAASRQGKDHAARRKKPLSFEERKKAYDAGEKELQLIFERTYGPVKKNLHSPENEKDKRKDNNEKKGTSLRSKKQKSAKPIQEFLLVDGYNIIFAWKDLKELAEVDIKAARDQLLDIMSDYAGYSGLLIIVVFDAYRVLGGKGDVQRYHNIDVVYTREAETADLYIEKTAHRLAKEHRVTVATGDALEQVIIFGAGALRQSPRGLLEAILSCHKEMEERFLNS